MNLRPDHFDGFLGTAHLTLGLWTLVAAATVGVTWEAPDKPGFSEISAVSRLTLAGGLTWLVLTATIHLSLGRRLRQGRRAISTRTILLLALAHTLVLGTILIVSLRNPKSPAFLGGAEELLAALTSTGVLAGCLLIFTLWWLNRGANRGGQPRRSPPPAHSFAFKWLLAGHFVTALLLAAALLRLDSLAWPM